MTIIGGFRIHIMGDAQEASTVKKILVASKLDLMN